MRDDTARDDAALLPLHRPNRTGNVCALNGHTLVHLPLFAKLSGILTHFPSHLDFVHLTLGGVLRREFCEFMGGDARTTDSPHQCEAQ